MYRSFIFCTGFFTFFYLSSIWSLSEMKNSKFDMNIKYVKDKQKQILDKVEMTSQQDSAKLSISWLDTQHNCSVPWACSCVHIVCTLPQQQLFSSASEKLFLITTLAMNECSNEWREIAESLTICVWQLSVILSQVQDLNKAQCEVEWRRNWLMKSNLYNIHILYFPPLNKDYYFDSLLCLSFSSG